jgi:hypothetical protein
MFRIQYAVGAVLMAGALGLIAPKAEAQSYKGTFDLPYETKWGGSVLEPGHYELAIAGEINGINVLKVNGPGGFAAVLTGPAERTSIGEHGRIILANVDGVYALRQFDAAAIGRSYTFPLPKSKHNRAAGGSTPATTTVISIN